MVIVVVGVITIVVVVVIVVDFQFDVSSRSCNIFRVRVTGGREGCGVSECGQINARKERP